MGKLGIWIIGARGSVASAVIAGAKLLAKGSILPVGLVTELPSIKVPQFVSFDQIVFGGYDIRSNTICDRFSSLLDSANASKQVLHDVDEELRAVEKEVCLGTAVGCETITNLLSDISSPKDDQSLEGIIGKIEQDINNFRERYSLDDVIVINLASTEPSIVTGPHTERLEDFEKALKDNRKHLMRASTIYAYVAFKCGCPYINFTPSAGASIPALMEFAEYKRIPHAGRDGKTGETLVKSTLSSMFKYRALKVLSWQGYNILGNQDGQVLEEPDIRNSKIMSKDKVISHILGYNPHTHVGIDYVPSLEEWKVAWDYIHFEGFLGTKMSMQFIWQGCDSILAAPLVLDLIRLVHLAHEKGERGPLSQLALFFKDPIGTNVNDLHTQWQLLENYIKRIREEAK